MSDRVERIKSLFKGIDPKKDTFLGESCVQIRGFDGYPSVHTVRSYLIDLDPFTQYLYHIFRYHCGTSVANYNTAQYDQVARFIDVSDYWDIYYEDDEIEPFLVNPVYRRK